MYQFAFLNGDGNQCNLKKYSYNLENGCCFYEPECEPQPCKNTTICVDVQVRKWGLAVLHVFITTSNTLLLNIIS